ncbi:MAG: diguanylate cyclase, partial [Firmicutes bacterium]|nr:diguanylate cyclase [Bacillota bacterium]
IIAGGYDAEQVRLDLDRSRLLEQFQKRRFFINKSYELNNKDGKILRLAAYCQLLLVNNEVFAAVLAINLSTLYDKAAVSKHDLAFDTVSGMFGRNYGERVCTEFLQYHPSIYAAVVSVNIRNFDVMNRHFGKRVGDMIISSLSAQLSDEVGSNCLITRSGSGRFSMLMEVEKEDVIISLLNALSQKERCIIDNEKKLGYKLSFGYSIYPDDSREYSELARMAEMALDYSDMHPNQPFFRFSDEIMLKSGSRHGFNIMDIANGIPGAILVYRADGNEEILYANNETIRLFECNDFDDFMQHVNGSFKGFVYKEDLDRVESTIWNQLNETNENRIDYVEYRIVTKNGLIREVDDIGRLIDSPYYGRIFYVFIHDMTTKESVLQNSLSHTSAVQAKFSQSSNNGGGK